MDWNGTRVFLTGHTGFKGGWLSLWLQQLGASVCGYSLDPPTVPSVFQVARVAEGMDSVIGDIRDLPGLRAALCAFKPEVVIHMAAQPLVRFSYQHPVETYTTNVIGTANVLEAVRSCPSVRAVLVVTTDKCYENREWLWAYREDDRLGGYDPYSSSKACAELVVGSWRNSFFNPAHYADHHVAVASARAGNVIGGGDWAEDRLVPDIMKAFIAGEPAIIRNPNSVRPWQHVLEPLRGYIALCEKLLSHGVAFGEAWNFGPESSGAQPVEWIVEQLASIWGEGAMWECDQGVHPHEAKTLRLEWSKAHTRLGWKPTLGLAEALTLTAEWYSAWKNGSDMRALTLRQIAEFGGRTREFLKA